MLSPLSLPCLPNDEVVFTMTSSASVCKIAKLHFYVIFFSSIMSKTTANKTTLVEAEWRLSENDHDHHHHKRRHHHHHHHHHHCLVWSYAFLINSSPQRQLPRLLNQLDYLSVHLEVLCSSFFGRPLPLMYQRTHNSIKYKMIKSILFTFLKANISCYKIQGKKSK